MAGQFDGFYDNPAMVFDHLGVGAFTPFGAILPPGGAVFFVRGNGTTVTVNAWDPPGLAERLNASVPAALRQCVSGRGDRIIVLEGHTENIATASAWTLVAGVKIIGVGDGDNRPTFTWTTATSTVLMNVANVAFSNLIFNFDPGAGTVTVAAPITVSATGCSIYGCKIRCGTDANAIVTIGITTTAAANNFTFGGNRVFGAVASPCTTFLRLVGGDGADIVGNRIDVATTSATVGVVQALTTAPTLTRIRKNYMRNSKSDSTAALTPMAAQTGEISDNYLEVMSTGLAHITTGSSMSRFQNFGKNTGADETGALLGTASA